MAGCGLHACAEHFDGTDDGGGGYAGDGAGEKGGVGVADVCVYRTGFIEAQSIVSRKVDDIGGNGHDKGGA